MDLLTDRATAIAYLDDHPRWFRRCAKPLRAEPIGTTGYALGVGRVGAFGFYVEPQVGLDLLPQENGVYRIRTVPVPGMTDPGYKVDFNAEMDLQEKATPADLADLAPHLTAIEWTLDLAVSLSFPDSILRRSEGWILRTGNAVLAAVVKRVSMMLTAKVQADFHQSVGLAVPPKMLKRLRESRQV
ncbi:MAG: DUF1997 domain-containing protein [Pseudanabaenaceae cyanobacterium]